MALIRSDEDEVLRFEFGVRMIPERLIVPDSSFSEYFGQSPRGIGVLKAVAAFHKAFEEFKPG